MILRHLDFLTDLSREKHFQCESLHLDEWSPVHPVAG
jgi:hypothetical protein